MHNPIIYKLYNLVLLFTYAFKLLELNENLRCIILGTYCLNTRNRVRLDALLIGPIKVDGFPISMREWKVCPLAGPIGY